MAATERPLRADAERNRRRVMDAARELFAQRGLDVTLNDIAHHAGVGVGTVYRRFPDKAVLIEALFEERVEELVEIARAGLDDPDPMNGFVTAITRVLEVQEADRGMKELMLSVDSSRQRVGRIRELMAPIVAQLVARARASGELRSEIAPQDFPMIQIMLGAVIDVGRDAGPGLWRRYLELLVQGMRAQPQSPPPLSVPAPGRDRMQSVLSTWRPPRRA
jgi:AcrR family transcriptional regulator